MAKQTASTGSREAVTASARSRHSVHGAGPEDRVDKARLAALVADQIIGDIGDLGWPVGEIVGSEADLLERYGVSRGVFREAVRLLEHRHVARMRRGPGGGLVVAAPSVDSVTPAVSVYLFYVGAEIDEVFAARLALEEAAVDLACERLDEQHISTLRAYVAREQAGEVSDPRELHNLIATVTDNPALVFFVDLLNRVTQLFLPAAAGMSKRALAESAHAHEAIVDAILRDEPTLARSRMRKHLQAEADFLRAGLPSRRRLAADLPQVVGHSDKLAERIARQMFREVASDGWPVGTLFGSSTELMKRYDVSQAVLREAVRLLEHHQVARMRRGPGGGLFVIEPGIEAVTGGVALQVDRLGVTPHHLFEVRAAVELAVLDLAMVQLDDDVVARLERAVEAERAATGAQLAVIGHDLHAVLASVAGNRVIELLVHVLVGLTRFHMVAPPKVRDPSPATRDVVEVHQRIIDAILARDVTLARHRMRRHLDALMELVR